MISSVKILSFTAIAALFSVLGACTDELSLPGEDSGEVAYVDEFPGLPDEIRDGYSIAFQLNVDPMSGEQLSLSTRATGESLREIERFVDLEKLRVLFFTCLDDNDIIDSVGKLLTPERLKTFTGTQYETGEHDYFLFEAKSRWVSVLSTADASDASYQVTAPVFTYGNNEDYQWNKIREILQTRPFKVVVLANRPDSIHAVDYDGGQYDDPYYYDNKGPYWGRAESDATINLYNTAQTKNFTGLGKTLAMQEGNNKIVMINDLHHCEWDAVYAYKNKDYGPYDFILKSPQHHTNDNGKDNWMGAVTSWTNWMTHDEWKDLKGENDQTFANADYHKQGKWISNPKDKDKPINFYQLPDKNQGIPMYGCQKFDPLTTWKEGTPMNLSPSKNITSNASYNRKVISLLRSLARIELYIPTSLGFKVTEPSLMYSNVFGRTEPIDVATPTDRLMKKVHDTSCEWNDLYKYGPVVTSSVTSMNAFLNKMSYFYGTWRHWWNFNGVLDPNSTSVFPAKTYPHIFNPCIQRNGTARLDFVQTTDDETQYYHYVVYTGERNINDPNKFNDWQTKNTEFMYFQFNVGNNTYNLPINPLNTGKQVQEYLKINASMGNYRAIMAESTDPNEWNYPILRNHVYTFRVTKANGATDGEGIDALVIVAEDRNATIDFW
ncbi:MAG: hypothetical protein J1D77_05650 [Muribaculaceae bacterium]|nr:hypothetical protein [Muribaculaceae bacterium]